jgi:hypothetical protein
MRLGPQLVYVTEWFEQEDIRGSPTYIGRGGVLGSVLHKVLKVGTQLNFAANC